MAWLRGGGGALWERSLIKICVVRDGRGLGGGLGMVGVNMEGRVGFVSQTIAM